MTSSEPEPSRDASEPSAPDGAEFATSVNEVGFVDLLTAHQLRLRAYLIAMVRKDHDADDLLQETNVALWNKRAKYDPQRPFYTWACGVAFIEVLRYRRRQQVDKLWLDPPLLEIMSVELVKQGDLFEDRRDALAGCLKRLETYDRWLVETRYREGISVNDLAVTTGKPLKTIYSTLSRIRRALFRCVEQALAEGERLRTPQDA